MKRKILSTFFAVALMISFSGTGLLATETCQAGGPGSSECQWENTFSIFGIPIIDQTGPSVTCQDGYYACCGPSTATCVSNVDL